MKLVITTQYRENYGAHDWDGKGACPQYWKCKGGDVYVVPNLSEAQIKKVNASGIPNLTALIESRSEHSEECVIGWSVVNDDAKVCDEWDTPTNLYYEDGRWVARIYAENGEYGYMRREVASRFETYTMLTGGWHADHSVVYTMRNGDVVDSTEVQDYFTKLEEKVAA